MIKVFGHPSHTLSVSALGGGLTDLVPTPPEAVPPGNPVSDHLASRVLQQPRASLIPPALQLCVGIRVRRPTLEAKRGSPSSALLLAPDRNPRPSKLRVLGEGGEKGPLQAGTARRHIWNCELVPSSGPWGQGGVAFRQPGGEDPQRDPGVRSPRMGEGLKPAPQRLVLGAPVGWSSGGAAAGVPASRPHLTRAASKPRLGAPPRRPVSN